MLALPHLSSTAHLSSPWPRVLTAKVQLQFGGAGCFANCSEYVQILTCLLNGGKHPKTGARILSEESTKELLKPQITKDHPAYKGLETAIPDVMDDLTMPVSTLYCCRSR